MNRLFKNRLTALLLTLVMVIGMVPAASAATTADLTFEVEYDEEVKLARSKFVNLLEDETGDDDLGYVEITKVSSDFDDYGYFIAKDIDGTKVEIKKAADLKTYYFYDDEYFDDLGGDEDEDFLLDGLTFYAYDDAEDGTVTVEFTVWNYDEDEDYDGVLEIDIIGVEDDKDDFDEDDYDLVFEVEADDDVEIKLSTLKSLYKEETKKTLYYAEITAVDSTFTNYGAFKAYYDDEAFTLDTASKLKAPDFYVSASDLEKYGDEDRDFELGNLTFVAKEKAKDGYFTFTLTMWNEAEDKKFAADIAIVIGDVDDSSSSSSSKNNPFKDYDEDDYDLVYEVEADDEVEFKLSGLKSLFKNKTKATLYYAEITAVDSDFDDYGYFEAYYDDEASDLDTASKLKAPDFYVSASDLEKFGDEDKDYELGGLTFVADKKAEDGYFTLQLTMWDEDEEEKYVADIAVVIGDPDAEDDDDTTSSGSSAAITADLTYSVDPKKSVELKRKDFKNLFEEEYDDFAYVTFDKITNLEDNGYFTATDYYEDEYDFKTAKSLKEICFFYSADEMKDEDYDYELNGLTFTADKNADGEVVMVEFTMYGDKNDKKTVEGIFIIQIGDVQTTTGSSTSAQSSIRKSITSNSALQINVNDIERIFRSQYPGSSLQYVKLMNVPSIGALYYDYYNTSGRTQMNASNITSTIFYRDAYGSQTDLGKLTYIPTGSNYCTSIVFVAYGTAGQQAIGTLNISVTTNTVSEVYGVTPKNTSVTFPASAIYSAVYNATGKAMASIKLMELPASNTGKVTGNLALAANTTTSYTYASGTNSIGQLKFNPATGYTGSVEIPYMAYDASGNPIAMGSFSLGVVNSVKKFSDVTSSTWCYKYVTELSDAGVIGGYTDGSFKPNNTITYGAALKLVTLAAGHGEKAPLAGGHTFSGYLAYAQQKGWVTGNVNLSGNITRLQIAQLAAKAMGLSVSNLSANRPFTDTADVYVQALNAAGIIEGYFSNGSYAYRPSNTLTRGQVSAIVWRMRNYKG